MDAARPAAAGDIADLARLWQAALVEMAAQRGGATLAGSLEHDDLEGYLGSAIASSRHFVVVGLLDTTPVGLASLRAGGHPTEPVADLELIYVEPPARRVGVADTMLDLAAGRAREWGMTGIDGLALPGNRAAKSFFEANGYTARLLVMHRRLDSSQP